MQIRHIWYDDIVTWYHNILINQFTRCVVLVWHYLMSSGMMHSELAAKSIIQCQILIKIERNVQNIDSTRLYVTGRNKKINNANPISIFVFCIFLRRVRAECIEYWETNLLKIFLIVLNNNRAIIDIIIIIDKHTPSAAPVVS